MMISAKKMKICEYKYMFSIKEQCKSGKHYYKPDGNHDSIVCKKIELLIK